MSAIAAAAMSSKGTPMTNHSVPTTRRVSAFARCQADCSAAETSSSGTGGRVVGSPVKGIFSFAAFVGLIVWIYVH
jgi:hypothetical protein